MSGDPDLPRDDVDGDVAEYVLGTLDAAERDAFARRLATDAGLRAAVAAWEARLAPLAAGVAPVAPDPGTWPAVRARLGEPAREGPSAERPRVVVLERSLRRWRVAAAAATALAACLAILLAAPSAWRRGADAGERYVAVVDRGGTLPALIVRVDTASGAVHVRSLAAETPPDRSLELWYVAPGAAPRSLGVLDAAAPRPVLPAGLRGTADQGATLAVSVEPKGGSPTGTATGPIVYSGRLMRE